MNAEQKCHEDAHIQASEWMQKAMKLEGENELLRDCLKDVRLVLAFHGLSGSLAMVNAVLGDQETEV